MHDRHASASRVPGWVLGLAGLAFGVASMVMLPALALLAGFCALAAGALAAHAAAKPAPDRPPDRRRPAIDRAAGPRPTDRLQASSAELTVALATDRSNNRRMDLEAGITATHGAIVLIDPATGLFGEDYLRLALEARIAAARRQLRPLSVVLLEIAVDPSTDPARGPTFGPIVVPAGSGPPPRGCRYPAEPQRVAAAIKATVREADTTGRFADGRYLLVLEETPEDGAIWTVERLRSALGAERPGARLWAGIACYPAHAIEPGEILQQARDALAEARQWPSDRIEVAVEP